MNTYTVSHSKVTSLGRPLSTWSPIRVTSLAHSYLSIISDFEALTNEQSLLGQVCAHEGSTNRIPALLSSFPKWDTPLTPPLWHHLFSNAASEEWGPWIGTQPTLIYCTFTGTRPPSGLRVEASSKQPPRPWGTFTDVEEGLLWLYLYAPCIYRDDSCSVVTRLAPIYLCSFLLCFITVISRRAAFPLCVIWIPVNSPPSNFLPITVAPPPPALSLSLSLRSSHFVYHTTFHI